MSYKYAIILKKRLTSVSEASAFDDNKVIRAYSLEDKEAVITGVK